MNLLVPTGSDLESAVKDVQVGSTVDISGTVVSSLAGGDAQHVIIEPTELSVSGPESPDGSMVSDLQAATRAQRTHSGMEEGAEGEA
jgi:hypothetical protein